MANLIVSSDAKVDLDEVLNYLVEQAGSLVARQYNQDFQNKWMMLAEYPMMGPARSKLGKDIRIAFLEQYIIIHRYDVATNTVTILRIIHGKRNITKKLIRE